MRTASFVLNLISLIINVFTAAILIIVFVFTGKLMNEATDHMDTGNQTVNDVNDISQSILTGVIIFVTIMAIISVLATALMVKGSGANSNPSQGFNVTCYILGAISCLAFYNIIGLIGYIFFIVYTATNKDKKQS